MTCRYCRDDENTVGLIEGVCLCTGSIRWIHRQCLQTANKLNCPNCLQPFNLVWCCYCSKDQVDPLDELIPMPCACPGNVHVSCLREKGKRFCFTCQGEFRPKEPLKYVDSWSFCRYFFAMWQDSMTTFLIGRQMGIPKSKFELFFFVFFIVSFCFLLLPASWRNFKRLRRIVVERPLFV